MSLANSCSPSGPTAWKRAERRASRPPRASPRSPGAPARAGPWPPVRRRPGPGGAQQEVDQRPGRPAEGRPADHVQRQVRADVQARDADQRRHHQRDPADPPRQVGTIRVAMATATAACPDTNPRPLSWWPRRWTLSSRSTGRPRPTWSLIHRHQPHPDAGDGQVGGQPELPRGRDHRGRHPDGEHVAGLHDHPERREQGRRGGRWPAGTGPLRAPRRRRGGRWRCSRGGWPARPPAGARRRGGAAGSGPW